MTKFRDTIETAAELADRFPDMTDGEILDFMGEYNNTFYDDRMIISRVILVAYNSGTIMAYDHAKRVYGIDMR